MRPHDTVKRAKTAKRTRRALQLATCLSVLVLSCSVYDANLLAGRGALESGDAGTGSLPDPSGAGGSVDGSAGAAADEGGRGGAADHAPDGDSNGGEAGALSQDNGGASVVVTYGGAGGSGSVGGSGVGGSGVGGGSGGSGGSAGAGVAGSPPVVRELGKNKPSTASTAEAANGVSKGNDGDSATRWCASSAAMPQWWRVDLGDTHPLTQVVLKFEHPERKYTYVIETSPNDAVFTQRAMVNGTGDTQTIDMPAGVSARYVRVTVTAGASYTASNGMVYPTFASFWELRVYGY